MEQINPSTEFPDRFIPEIPLEEEKPPVEKTPEDIANERAFEEHAADLQGVFSEKINAYKEKLDKNGKQDLGDYFDAQNRIADFSGELYKKYNFAVKKSKMFAILLGSTTKHPAGWVFDFHDADEEIQDFIINKL